MLVLRVLLLLLVVVPSLAHAASPVVATTNTTADTDGTSTVINMPASISAGDLLVCWDTNDATGTPRAQSGGSDWTRISTGANGTVISMAIFAKIAAGSDTLTLAGAAQDAATVCARVTGHGVTNVSVDIMIGTPATGLDAAPDPPNVAHGGPQDYLVLESAHSDDDDDTATYWSSGYSAVNQVQSASSTSSCLTSVGQLAVSNTAENPGVMALAASEDWVAQTISVPPALPTEYTKYSDSFTRADENPLSDGGRWDGGYFADSLQVVSNTARVTAINTNNMMAVNAVGLTDNQWAQVTMSTAAGSVENTIRLLLRVADPTTQTFYELVARNNTGLASLWKYVAGAESAVKDVAVSWTSGDVMKAYAIGTRLTLQKNGVAQMTAVDGSITSGRPGLLMYVATSGASSDVIADNYSAGDFTAPAGSCAGTRLLVGAGC